ncbi:MAG: hypothetical protein FIB04_09605 [Gammaproteobacteria bacterium]|nr:hypothetical protein [Gammaproteobacteria bacterium]
MFRTGSLLPASSRLGPTLLCMVAAAIALAGCKTIEDMTPSARKAEETKPLLVQRQARNLRFADEYVGRLIEAVRDTEPMVMDAGQRYVLSGWLLEQANAAYISASGDSPVVSSLDLVTLATLSRMVVEETIGHRLPPQAQPLLTAHRELESAAWLLVTDTLSPAQQQELRSLFVEWQKQNPDVVNVPFVRFQSFVNEMHVQDAKGGTLLSGGLMGLIGLDPMAGLDPAVRQVEQTRLMAERAIFYAQRMPVIFDLQLDRSLNRMAAGPESQKLQQQTASLADSAARFAAVAEALPATLSAERDAAIRQLSDTLESQQATLRPMLLDVRAALEAGNTAATSVDQAVQAIDTLVARFDRKPGEPPGKPFDISEYTQAAAEITRAANQLQVLLGTVGTQAPQLGTALDASVSKGRSLVDYFFVRVAWLIALFCVGLLATLLLYRWLAPRVRPT